MAGAFYAYELILGSYSSATLAQVAMASLTGTLVMNGTIGGAPVFLVETPGLLVHHWEYPLFGLLGVTAGGVGIATMMMVTCCETGLRCAHTPECLRPAVGELILSALAALIPQALGSGHGGIQDLFIHTPSLGILSALLLAKMVASALSIGAGFRGGLFSSSLFLGCLFGGVVAKTLALLGSWGGDHQTLFMLVGMGSVAASIVGAPLTMVLLVLELTGDFPVTLCVLAGVVTASITTRYTFGYSFSTWRFHQRGVSIRGAHDIGWVSELTVGRMMRGDPRTVRHDVPLLRLREMAPLGSLSHIFAVDETNHYAGLIDVAVTHDTDLDAAAAIGGQRLGHQSAIFSVAQPRRQKRNGCFAEAETEALPVLAGDNDRRVMGYLPNLHAPPLCTGAGAPPQHRTGRAQFIQRPTPRSK